MTRNGDDGNEAPVSLEKKLLHRFLYVYVYGIPIEIPFINISQKDPAHFYDRISCHSSAIAVCRLLFICGLICALKHTHTQSYNVSDF